MDTFFQNFFLNINVFELILIFFSRIIEVSMGTVRIILISKGYRTIGAIIGFFEVTIWVFVASRVITGLSESPIKAVVYSLGFAMGIYLGGRLENRLAFGKMLIQAIIPQSSETEVTSALRDKGLAVTVMAASGMDSQKAVLYIYTPRKGKDKIIELIMALEKHALVVSNEISTLQGGTLTSYRRFVK